MTRITWPVVACLALGFAFFLGIFALAQDSGQRQALIGALVALCSALTVLVSRRDADHVTHRIDKVEKKITDAIGAETVSRETSARETAERAIRTERGRTDRRNR